MASMGTTTIDVNDVLKDTHCVVTVNVAGIRRFKARLWLARYAMRVIGWLIGFGSIKVVTETDGTD